MLLRSTTTTPTVVPHPPKDLITLPANENVAPQDSLRSAFNIPSTPPPRPQQQQQWTAVSTPVTPSASPSLHPVDEIRRSTSALPLPEEVPPVTATGLRQERQAPRLRPGYHLPCITGEHPDLPCISCETLAHLLSPDAYALDTSRFDTVLIVDCRYPFEYEGGHIVGAVNLTVPNLRAKLKSYLLGTGSAESSAVLLPTRDTRRTALVFHCEFSRNRGPSTLRLFRSLDAAESYPEVSYDQCYLLDGGYRDFHGLFPQLCCGGYVPMVEKTFKKELSHFTKLSHVEKKPPRCQTAPSQSPSSPVRLARPTPMRGLSMSFLPSADQQQQTPPYSPVWRFGGPLREALEASEDSATPSRSPNQQTPFSTSPSASSSPSSPQRLLEIPFDLSNISNAKH